MSTQVFPTLSGLTFGVERTQEWCNTIQTSVSGKETRVAYWSEPRYTWTLNFEFLRVSTAYPEFQNLWSFVSARQGRYDSFLYTDYIDNAVTGAALGAGDSTNTDFQLVSQFGGSSSQFSPVYAANAITKVAIAGSSVSSTTYSVGVWESTWPGILRFTTPPPTGQAVTADYSYYFPVRFDEDVTTFAQFMYNLWDNREITMKSIK